MIFMRTLFIHLCTDEAVQKFGHRGEKVRTLPAEKQSAFF